MHLHRLSVKAIKSAEASRSSSSNEPGVSSGRQVPRPVYTQFDLDANMGFDYCDQPGAPETDFCAFDTRTGV